MANDEVTSEKLREGDVVAGRYHVERVLGEGGDAVVYAVRNVRTERAAAMKVLRVGATANRARAERFLREAAFSAALRHPNLCEVFDTVTLDDGRVALVEELLDRSLDVRLRDGRPLDDAELRAWLLPVLDALATVHAAGVVHGDVKPANIMWRPRPGGGEGVLVDLGLAGATRDDNASASMVMGSPMYMAPEQFRRGVRGPEVDQFAAGLVLLQCLTAQPPSAHDSIPTLLLDRVTKPQAIPDAVRARPELAAVIERATRIDPTERFTDIGAMRGELEVALGASRHGVIVGAPEGVPLGPPVDVRGTFREAAVAMGRPHGLDAHVAAGPPASVYGQPHLPPPPTVSTRTGGLEGLLRWPVAIAARDPEAAPWEALRDAIPPGFERYASGLETFLAASFERAAPCGEFVVSLSGDRLADLGVKRFYAIMLASTGTAADGANLASTQAFVYRAATLTEHLQLLPSTERKLVLAFFDADELGAGIRVKIAEFRARHGALVVPVSLAEVAQQPDPWAVRALLSERLQEFHRRPDLYSAPVHANDPLTYRGLRPQQSDLASRFDGGAALVAVCGLIGVGKHALLWNLEQHLDGWRVLRVDALTAADRSVKSLATSVTKALRPDAPDAGEPWEAALREALRGVTSRAVLVLARADWIVRRLIEPDVEAGERGATRAFWSVLTAAVRDGQVGVVVVGSLSYLLTERSLAGWDNPASSVATTLQVRGLSPTDLEALVRGLGAQIDLRWDDDAVRAVWRWSAGVPRLARALCSEVLRRHSSGGGAMPSWRPVVVSEAMVDEAAEALASDPSAFPALRTSFTEAELRVYAAIAAGDGVTLDALRDAGLGDDVSAVAQRLQATGMIALNDAGRLVCAVPLMARWAKTHCAPRDARPRRSMAAITVGAALSAVVLGALLWHAESSTEKRDLTVRWDGCRYRVELPTQVPAGGTVKLHLTRRCDGVAPSRPAIEVVPDDDTRLTLSGQERSTLPLTWAAGSDESRAGATFALDGDGPYALTLRSGGESTRPMRVTVDRLATALAALRALGVKAVVLPTMLGAVVTFFRDLTAALRGLAGAFSREPPSRG